MAFTSWNTLGMGKVRTDAEEEAREEAGEKGRTGFTDTWLRNEIEKKVCGVLEKMGKEIGTGNIRASESIQYQ